MASLLPTSLGRYEVLEELGKGAMGVVYLARDPLIGRLVALKTFRAAQAMHGAELVEYRARFMREAQSAGILSHPNIVTIHDVVDSSEGGITFIAMEYVQGINLKELLLRGEPMSLEQVVRLVAQLGDALDYAHSKGVIHRDIKPANIILDHHGQAKITDFGIARLETSDLTHEGQLLGTPNYMAPERILGHRVDHRTDIFSLGVVVYEMLTRQKPFQGENLTMVSHRIVYEPFTPPRQYVPGLPPGVVAVLDRALEKDPEKRFASAGSLAKSLRDAVSSATGGDTRIGPRPQLGEPPQPPPAPVVPLPPPGDPSGAYAVAEDPGAETQDVSRAFPRPHPGARSRRLPAAGRIAVVGAAAAVVGLLLAAAAFGWLRWQQPAAGEVDARPLLAGRLQPQLRQARAELAAGRPEAARAVLAEAAAIAPNDPEVVRLEEQVRVALAQRQAATEQLAQSGQLVAAAEAALAAGELQQAADLARQVLALVPAEPYATAVLLRAEGEQARRKRQEAAQVARRQPPPEPRPPAPAPAAPVASAPPEPAPGEAAQVSLRIDFFTELPEGVLTVYAGSRRVLAEPFSFYKKVSRFRSEPQAGRIEAARQLDPGVTKLRIYVALPGEAPVVRTVESQLQAGSSRLLRIHFDRAKQMTATLE